MTKKEFNNLIKLTTKHYDRMISYVEKMNEYELKTFANTRDMLNIINESWSGEYCPMCDKFNHNGCIECPLDIEDYHCDNGNGPWMTMHESKTWEEWLVNAKKMREIIKGLDYKKYKNNLTKNHE
jgi:hypothetical protein